MRTKIIILGLIVPICLLFARSPELGQIYQLAHEFQNDADLIHGIWSLTVIDTQTGEVLAAVNSEKTLAPASCLKLVTSAAALRLLGPDFRFETRLEFDGQISPGGILPGNLYVTGGGDPTLGSDRIDSVLAWPDLLKAWADAVQTFGVRQICGEILADDTWFDDVTTPDGWLWVDLGNYYGAGANGLCFNENLYRLYFQPGKIKGDPARVLRTEPELPDLKFINQMSTGSIGSGDNGYIYNAPNQWFAWLRGTIPAGVDEFSIKGAMPDPAQVCGQLLWQELHSRQIQIDGAVRVLSKNPRAGVPAKQRNILARTQSPVLKDMVYWLNKRSINLYAEQILKQLGRQFKNTGSFEAGIEVVEAFLEAQQISTNGLKLADGSGLSPFNNITTSQLAQLLAKMSGEACFPDFYNSLPVAGDADDPGTVSKWCFGTVAAKNARIKTGLIGQVRSHAGYVHDRRGHLIAFAMIANRFDGTVRKIDRFHEMLVIKLAELR